MRKTPYSEITDIVDHGEFVEFNEIYELDHPHCPIVVIQRAPGTTHFTQKRRISKKKFELFYGSVEKIP